VPVIATPGSESALRLLPLLMPRGRVAIVSPTYGSHSRAWEDAGHLVTSVTALDQVSVDAAVIIIGNPNNPDGRLTAPETLADAAQRLARRGGLLVVDEAFGDVAPQVSLVPHLEALPAIVLRSFGKFFGLPGLRLGFAAGAASVVTRLATSLGEWPVTPTAIAVGTEALQDAAWQRRTRVDLAAAAGRLRSSLERQGHAVIGGTDLFVLIESADAGALHDRLARRGVWTRVFHDRPKWLRIGLPAGDAAFARLERAFSGR
jgi:cobalamin biosynthetic protein CobC